MAEEEYPPLDRVLEAFAMPESAETKGLNYSQD